MQSFQYYNFFVEFTVNVNVCLCHLKSKNDFQETAEKPHNET